MKEELDKAAGRFMDENNIPILPETLPLGIPVPESPMACVKTFATKKFDPEVAMSVICKGLPDEVGKLFSDLVTVKDYVACEVGRPPIPLKKDSLYLMATSGAGQGRGLPVTPMRGTYIFSAALLKS